MVVVPLSDLTFVYRHNKSVLYNTTLRELTLKKKLNSIKYREMRKREASKEKLSGWGPGHTHIYSMLTKPVYAGIIRIRLVRNIMYDI